MAEYTASTAIWSTCNGGIVPANGDTINVASLLAMDEDSAGAETFTVNVAAGITLNLAGWTLAATVTRAAGANINFVNGVLTGTITATASGGTIVLGTGAALVGAVDMAGNSCTWAGTGTLDCSLTDELDLGGAATGLSIEVSANTTTIVTDLTCLGFNHSAGTIICTGLPTISVGSGGFVSEGVLADNTVKVAFWENGEIDTYNRIIRNLHIPVGITATTKTGSGVFYPAALTGGGVLNIGDAAVAMRICPAANDFLSGWTGTISGPGYPRVYNTNYSPGGDLIITCAQGFMFEAGGSRTIVWDGNIDVAGPITIRTAGTATWTITLSVGKTIRCTDVTLGSDAAADHLVLSLLGNLIATGDIAKGAASASVSVALNSSHVQCNTFDGDGITITDTYGACHIMGVGAASELKNVATDNLILAHDFATYGANTNVGQDTHAAPGSMALCGVGY